MIKEIKFEQFQNAYSKCLNTFVRFPCKANESVIVAFNCYLIVDLN